MPTFRNDRTGATVELNATPDQIGAGVAEAMARDPNHWVWYHVARLLHFSDPNQAAALKATHLLGDMLIYALGHGRQNPMIRLHHLGRRYKLYLSRPTARNPRGGTLCLKSGGLEPVMVTLPDGTERQATWHKVMPHHPEDCRGCTADATKHGKPFWSRNPQGDEEYVGCWGRGGQWFPARQFAPRPAVAYGRRYNGGYRGRRYGRVFNHATADYSDAPATNGNGQDDRPLRVMQPGEQEFLDRLTRDPVGFLAELSKDMCRCCYCNAPLEDARSKVVGYGETCAERFGLPWGDPTGGEVTPPFTEVYAQDPLIASCCEAIRGNPRNRDAWTQFSERLQEWGLPPCEYPEGSPILPRA